VARTDGRDIDLALGVLSGEGSQQRVGPVDERIQQLEPKAWGRMPTVSQHDPTYYDRPMLKEPVWKIDIPLYYFLGGAAGAALALGAAAQLLGDQGLQKFGRNCHIVGIVGSTVGGGLLIHDLGRPERFLNMMRVFRPTSPMNVGAWILSGAAPLAITAGLFSNRPGIWGWIGSASGYGAGVFGLALAGYTGVLVGNTAIPLYQQVRRLMPVLFLSSAAASAASILDIVFEDPRASRITLFFGTAGRLAELATGLAIERQAEKVEQVARPLKTGLSGALWKTAEVLTVASLVLAVVPGESTARRKWAGVFGALGSLALRLAVHYAGAASARDPRASFRQQRARLASAEPVRQKS
jgi:formate-dependent nitrite reductase membrane component NrfD